MVLAVRILAVLSAVVLAALAIQLAVGAVPLPTEFGWMLPIGEAFLVILVLILLLVAIFYGDI